MNSNASEKRSGDHLKAAIKEEQITVAPGGRATIQVGVLKPARVVAPAPLQKAVPGVVGMREKGLVPLGCFCKGARRLGEGAGHDLHPDGQRFVVAAADSDATQRLDKVTFVFNFFDELRRIAPSKR